MSLLGLVRHMAEVETAVVPGQDGRTGGAVRSGHYRSRSRHGNVLLREVLVHMVEEYARHNGHADLLRERIDGRVGQ